MKRESIKKYAGFKDKARNPVWLVPQCRSKEKKYSKTPWSLERTLQNGTLFHSQWKSSTDFHKQGK